MAEPDFESKLHREMGNGVCVGNNSDRRNRPGLLRFPERTFPCATGHVDLENDFIGEEAANSFDPFRSQ